MTAIIKHWSWSRRAWLFVALMGVVVVSAVEAQAAGGRGLLRAQFGGGGVAAYCRADYFALCPGVPPGGGRVIACLNAHAEKLSQPCFQALAERGLAFASAVRLCRSDFDTLCPGVPPGMGRGLSCLLEQANRLSPPCRSALTAHGFETGGGGGGAGAPSPGGSPGGARPGGRDIPDDPGARSWR